MDALFKTSSTFASLSLKDLIEARDLFHYHLMNKKNVVATALGLYRIRKSDPWPSHDHPEGAKPRKPKDTRRTLFNSEVRAYSWPCVYVFVSSWQYESDLSKIDPSDVVPKSLFLPDGRAVPVCVIEARKQNFAKDLHVRMDGRTPRNLLGPGAAIVNNDSQGLTRLGTAGCIVRDGERYYVLTNRHVIGAHGTKITALQTHREIEIGVAAKKGLTREDFHAVYPHFQSNDQRLLMDIGLVEVDDILQWKTAFPGIAPVEQVLDFYDNSLSLKLIAMKVVGLGAVSGMIRGEIHALFYRYKAMGGSEYLSDFLIGPETYDLPKGQKKKDGTEEKDKTENVALGVHHGDSGAVLFIEHKEKAKGEAAKAVYYPFALLWGKEEFFEGRTSLSYPFALATSLSTALDRLDLDLVRDLNLDQEYVWGWVGHYVIGRSLGAPADIVTSPKLQAFIAKNLDLLSLEPDVALDNNAKVLEKDDETVHFVPLADVPDNVWKSNVNFTMVDGNDGKKHHKPGPGNRGKDDNKNHFADLDLKYLGGKTFLEMNVADPDTYLNPEAWVAYFAAMQPQYDEWAKLLKPDEPTAEHKDAHWGALPFRVHQLFDIMVKAAKAGNQDMFLSAGGVLIHYMGDACQPLHASYLSQGNPARVVKRPTVDTMILEADGVHSGYEDEMVAYGATEDNLAAKLKTRIAHLKNEPIAAIQSGNDAAKAVIALIEATQNEIAPKTIVDEWVKLKKQGKSKKEKAVLMWGMFGDDTITCMARGTRYLARIWQAAWDAGNGDASIGEGGRRKEGNIMDIYNDPGKIPSIPLDHYPASSSSDWSAIKRPAPGAIPAKGKAAKTTTKKAAAKKTAAKKARPAVKKSAQKAKKKARKAR
jgi:hypothetical protein